MNCRSGIAGFYAEQIEGLREKYVLPANHAVTATFDRSKALYVRAASQVVIVRRLSGYGDLLAQMGETLRTPWAAGFDPKYRHYGRGFPYWVATMNQATPFHRELQAVREANVGTLRLVHDKLQSLAAILHSMIAELPFADILKEPVPVPKTLIVVASHVDASTTVGENSKIEGSAVGKGASKQGR